MLLRDYLISISESTTIPWVVGGDFNVILSPEEVVKDVWVSLCHPNPLVNIAKKFKLLKGRVKDWNKEVFGNAVKRWEEELREISYMETDLHSSWQAQKFEALQAEKLQILETENQHEIFLRQKTRESRLREGDRNTMFFHAVLKERRKGMNMKVLEEHLRTLPGFVSVLEEGNFFFQNLLSAEDTREDQSLQEVIPTLVTEDENRELTRIPEDKEIRAAVFSMEKDTSPGPVGLIIFMKNVGKSSSQSSTLQ